MSTEDDLTERDKAVLGHIPDKSTPATVSRSETSDEAEGACEHEERFQKLESAVDMLQEELAKTRKELAEERQAKRELVQKINQLNDAVEGNHDLVGATNLEKYAQMTDEEKAELLPSSQQRAVEIYESWDDLAWKANGQKLLETQARANAKNNPSKIKYRLEKHFDQSLQANEIYRAMKAVAKLSGGEESTDKNGRTHITGGEFEYHVYPKADNSGTRRVLKRGGR